MINLFKFIIGSVLGSFVTLSSIRTIRNESIVFPASHCDHCQHRLKAWELIPVLSFLILMGRCSHCRKPIGMTAFIGESLSGLIILFNPLSFTGAIEDFFELLLLFVAERDYKSYLIPSWSLVILLLITLGQLFLVQRFSLKTFLITFLLYVITSLLNHHCRFIGNGDVDLIFILFLKLTPTLTLVIITIASFLAIIKYTIGHSSRLIPYAPYLTVTYLFLSWIIM